MGKSRKVIAVGCHDGEYYKNRPDRCETYSARGKRSLGERKPDIVAPGTDIISCSANFQINRWGVRNAYVKKSGTSMATAIVSGALGVLFAVHGEYGNTHAKQKLLYSARDLGEPWCKQGYGMLDFENLLL